MISVRRVVHVPQKDGSQGPNLSLLAELAGLCKQEGKVSESCALLAEAFGALPQHAALQQRLGDLLVRGCPTFWHLWAPLEEESSWATH